MKKISVIFIVMILMTNLAEASTTPKLIGVYQNWEAYEFKEDSGKVCYMASAPKTSEGKYTYRGDVIAMVTHRPGDSSKNVFSFKSGYNFEANSEVILKIDDKKWKLFTNQDTAWAVDEKSDNEIAIALQKGSTMSLEGTSSRGTYTKDTFSLGGTMSAYKTISTACNIE
jgi:hypothetical protein